MRNVDGIYKVIRYVKRTLEKPEVKRGIKWTAFLSVVISLILSTLFSTGILFLNPQKTQAALPTVAGVGTITKGLGAITPTMPTGVLTNDVLLLFIETSDQASTVSGGTETWAAVTGSPVTGATGTRLTVFWARASQNSPTSPTTNDSGDHQL